MVSCPRLGSVQSYLYASIGTAGDKYYSSNVQASSRTMVHRFTRLRLNCNIADICVHAPTLCPWLRYGKGSTLQINAIAGLFLDSEHSCIEQTHGCVRVPELIANAVKAVLHPVHSRET